MLISPFVFCIRFIQRYRQQKRFFRIDRCQEHLHYIHRHHKRRLLQCLHSYLHKTIPPFTSPPLQATPCTLPSTPWAPCRRVRAPSRDVGSSAGLGPQEAPDPQHASDTQHALGTVQTSCPSSPTVPFTPQTPTTPSVPSTPRAPQRGPEPPLLRPPSDQGPPTDVVPQARLGPLAGAGPTAGKIALFKLLEFYRNVFNWQFRW